MHAAKKGGPIPELLTSNQQGRPTNKDAPPAAGSGSTRRRCAPLLAGKTSKRSNLGRMQAPKQAHLQLAEGVLAAAARRRRVRVAAHAAQPAAAGAAARGAAPVVPVLLPRVGAAKRERSTVRTIAFTTAAPQSSQSSCRVWGLHSKTRPRGRGPLKLTCSRESSRGVAPGPPVLRHRSSQYCRNHPRTWRQTTCCAASFCCQRRAPAACRGGHPPRRAASHGRTLHSREPSWKHS